MNETQLEKLIEKSDIIIDLKYDDKGGSIKIIKMADAFVKVKVDEIDIELTSEQKRKIKNFIN